MSFNVHKLALMALAILSTVDANALVVRTGPPKQPSCVDFAPYVYAGCFKDDSSPRTLLYSSNLDSRTMTVEKCVAFCKGNDYKYAGLEYYGECYCGASVNALQIEEKNCNFPCNGNKTESCGGRKIISIYQDPTFPVVSTKTISDYMSMGCYSEGPNGRTLGWKQDDVNPTTLTVEKCLSTCLTGGYAFAGVEFGRECYCGVVLGNGTVPLKVSECNLRCTGDSTQFCGGRSKLNLYVARDLESAKPCEEDGPISSSSSLLLTTTSSTLPTSSSSTLTSSSITSSSPSTGFPSLTSSQSLASSSSSTESPSLTRTFSSLTSGFTTPIETISSSDITTSSGVLSTPIMTSNTESSSTTTRTSSAEKSSSSSTSFTSTEKSSSSTTTSSLESSSTSFEIPTSSGILPNPISTTTSSTEELSSSTTMSSSTENSSSSATNSSTESSSILSKSSSSSDVLPTTVMTSSSTEQPSPSTTSISAEFCSTSSEISSSSDVLAIPITSLTMTSSSTVSSSMSSETPSTSTGSPSSIPPFSTPTSTNSIFTTTVSISPPSVTYPSITTTSITPKTVEICTSYYTVYPPLPSPACAYKLGKWCAKPIPEFSDTFTCLKSFASCVTQLSACFSQAGYPELLKCNQFNEYCSQIAEFCDDFCPGKKCTLSSCKQAFPPYGVPAVPTKLSGQIFSSLYTCPPFTTPKPTPTSYTPFITTVSSKSTTTPAIPTYTNICTQPNNPAKGYGSYSPVGGIPLPNLSCNNDYIDYNTGHLFKLYTSSDTYACPSYEQSGNYGPSQGCKDACDEQFGLCNTGYADPYKGYKKTKRGGSDTYSSACQKCENQKNDCYLANKSVSGGQKCGTFNKGY